MAAASPGGGSRAAVGGSGAAAATSSLHTSACAGVGHAIGPLCLAWTTSSPSPAGWKRQGWTSYGSKLHWRRRRSALGAAALPLQVDGGADPLPPRPAAAAGAPSLHQRHRRGSVLGAATLQLRVDAGVDPVPPRPPAAAGAPPSISRRRRRSTPAQPPSLRELAPARIPSLHGPLPPPVVPPSTSRLCRLPSLPQLPRRREKGYDRERDRERKGLDEDTVGGYFSHYEM